MTPDGARVVVTGTGAVSGCGFGVEALWSHLAAGRSALRPVTRAFGDQALCVAASLVPEESARREPLVDPFARFALLAAEEAMTEAGLGLPLERPDRVAIVLGSGVGGELTREEAAIRIFHRGRRPHPMTVPRINHQASAALVSAGLGITGPCLTVATGCASAAHAIAQAWLMVRHGWVDAAVTGGSDASVVYSFIRAFEALRVTSTEPCSPFSRGRTGMSLGEGAGVVVLESLAHARARGAPILAELVGVGMTADGVNSVHPTVDGPARAMRAALGSAGLAPADIGYINAHGTGTVANDATECAAMREVFGVQCPPTSSTKSIHGHMIGAAGGIELVATILALRHQILPPTVNFVEADPACPVDCVPNVARPHRFDAALSSSFAFGGLNAVLALRGGPTW